jgi:hypothetical protein
LNYLLNVFLIILSLGIHAMEPFFSCSPSAVDRTSAHPTTPSFGKRDTGKQQSLTKKLIKRCNSKEDARRCEICDVPSAVFETAHLFDLAREKEYLTFFEADRDHMPISINNAENGVLICPNCHSYFDKKPRRLLHIKSNGTIELTGLAKEQNYAGLHGKKVPWADKINKKDWPSSALLEVVYHLPPKSRKRKGTDLDQGIVDATDLPARTPEKKGKATTAKKGKATTAKKGKVTTAKKGNATAAKKSQATTAKKG